MKVNNCRKKIRLERTEFRFRWRVIMKADKIEKESHFGRCKPLHNNAN